MRRARGTCSTPTTRPPVAGSRATRRCTASPPSRRTFPHTSAAISGTRATSGEVRSSTRSTTPKRGSGRHAAPPSTSSTRASRAAPSRSASSIGSTADEPTAGGRRLEEDRTRDEETVLARDRQREREAIDLEGELGVAAREPVRPAFGLVVGKQRHVRRWQRLVTERGREVAHTRRVLVRVLAGVVAHGDERHLVGVLPEITHGRAGGDEAPEEDPARPRRRDHALRSGARPLDHAASGEIELLDERR